VIAETPTEELPALAPPSPRLVGDHLSRRAAEIWLHRRVADHPAVPKRPADHSLYRQLERLERERRR
jgi:hypothetical protein